MSRDRETASAPLSCPETAGLAWRSGEHEWGFNGINLIPVQHTMRLVATAVTGPRRYAGQRMEPPGSLLHFRPPTDTAPKGPPPPQCQMNCIPGLHGAEPTPCSLDRLPHRRSRNTADPDNQSCCNQPSLGRCMSATPQISILLSESRVLESELST